MKQIIYTNKQGYSETHIFDNSGSIVSVLNSDAYQQVSLSVTPEKTNEVVNYIAFAFVYGYNENEMTVDNAEVNISPLIQSSEDSKNETSEKEAVDEEVLSESIDKSKPYMQTSYDSNGMRTQKTVDGVKTNYYYDSNKNLIALVKGNDTLLFYYDSEGSATSFSYNGTMYFYVKNLQGDVIRIIDLAGTEVASYVYDAWGNIKDTKGDPTVRELNPIRYRGYVYDTETSLYYLQSRYYDPLTGRFLNADTNLNSNILGLNVYIYCYNDSVNYLDRDGFQPIWAQIICGEAKDTELYKWFVEITQKGEFPGLFYIAGFVRDEKGIYHARQDCLQQYAGYNDFYDFMFNLGTQMEKQKFPFRYDGQDYILWAWKGDYLNLGAGAEMGIYYGGEPHWLVDTNLTLNMALFVEYNHRMIISFTPKEKYWWITGFNPYYQSPNIKMLKVTVRVRFDNPTMFMAFYNKHHRNPHLKFVPQWYTGVLEF